MTKLVLVCLVGMVGLALLPEVEGGLMRRHQVKRAQVMPLLTVLKDLLQKLHSLA